MWKYLKRNENDEGYFVWFLRLFSYVFIGVGSIICIIIIINIILCLIKYGG